MLRSSGLLRTTTFVAILLLIAFPGLPLQLWVIPLVISFYARPLLSSLWRAILMGTTLDLLSSADRIGAHALSAAITTYLLYRLKRRFFEDSITTLATLTSVYSALFSLFLVIIATPPRLSWRTLVTDIIILPLADGTFAFLLISLPLLLWKRRPLAADTAAHRPR